MMYNCKNQNTNKKMKLRIWNFEKLNSIFGVIEFLLKMLLGFDLGFLGLGFVFPWISVSGSRIHVLSVSLCYTQSIISSLLIFSARRSWLSNLSFSLVYLVSVLSCYLCKGSLYLVFTILFLACLWSRLSFFFYLISVFY